MSRSQVRFATLGSLRGFAAVRRHGAELLLELHGSALAWLAGLGLRSAAADGPNIHVGQVDVGAREQCLTANPGHARGCSGNGNCSWRSHRIRNCGGGITSSSAARRTVACGAACKSSSARNASSRRGARRFSGADRSLPGVRRTVPRSPVSATSRSRMGGGGGGAGWVKRHVGVD